VPELPDVEAQRRFLEDEALGRRIERVEVLDRRPLGGLPSATFAGALEGRALTATARHGKWLFAEADAGPWLVLHFRMTGSLAATAAGEPAPSYARITFRFADGGALHFRDQRRFGVVGLAEDPGSFAAAKRLGPDALDPALTLAAFGERLARRSGPLKGILLDQGFVAGVGNIYGDEICYAAGIAPLSRVERFSSLDTRGVYRAMRSVLETAVARMIEHRDFPDRWLIHERRPGGICPRCGGSVARVRFRGRYTYWCPCAQRGL
jgi:formamidopyrimidine-DNA glycosylase